MFEMRIPFIAVTMMLTANSISDLIKKEICLKTTLILTAFGIIFQLEYIKAGLITILLSIVPGIFMIALSIITKERIGMGDGIVVLCVGIWNGFYSAVSILMTGMFMAAICGIVLFFFKRKVKEFPFVPFLLAAELITALF
jgi:leader peptidase (prepilin peptidase)/N-methyltransferase